MKKFLTKKTLAVAVLAIALVVAGIGTYAYWVIEIPPEPDGSDMNMAVLDYDINGGFDDLGVGYTFKPGASWSYAGAIAPSIHNTMEFIAKITLVEPVTTIKNGPLSYPNAGWQADGSYGKFNPLAQADWWTITPDPMVSVAFDDDYLGWGGQDDENCFAWFQDLRAGYEDDLYVVIWGNPTFQAESLIDGTVTTRKGVPIFYDVTFSADAGLMYMGATTNFNESWVATQFGTNPINAAWGDGTAENIDLIDVEIEVDTPPIIVPFGFNFGKSGVTFADIQAKVAAALAE